MNDAHRKKPAEKQHDVFFSRALLLLQRLSEDRSIAIVDLANEFSVNTRTIRRDIDRLHFFPLSYKRGVVSVDEGFSIEHTRLTGEELLYMEMAFGAVEELSNDAHQKFHSIRAKFSYPMYTTPYEIKAESFETIDMDSPLLNKIEDAIIKCNIATLTSNAMQSQVEPYKIVAFDGIWYLFAKDITDDKIKTYLISTIEEFHATTRTHGSNMEKIEQMLDNVHTAWFEDGHSFKVTVKVKPPVAEHFKLKRFFPSQELIKERKDGSIIVSFNVSSNEDVDNLIKAWLPHIEIITPKHFRRRLTSELESYLSALKSIEIEI